MNKSQELLDAMLSPFDGQDELNETASMLKAAIQSIMQTREKEIMDMLKEILLDDDLSRHYKRSEDYRYEVIFRLHELTKESI